MLITSTILIWNCHSHKHASIIEYSDSEGYFGNYNIQDAEYGTKTTVTVEGDYRVMVTNALPNHLTGEFPNLGNPNTIRAQKRTYKFPVNPQFTGNPKWAREPGVAINGVKFEPETAEIIECATGENYRIEAMQTMIDLGLDFNHAHVQPTGAYHYHGTPTGIVNAIKSEEDLVHIGFAMDGFPIYYSKSGAYKPSYKLIDDEREGTDCVYENPHNRMDVTLQATKPDGTFKPDWEYVKGLGDLDECNGIMIDGNYFYLVTDNYPFVGRCLKGEFEEQRRGPRGPRPPRGRRGERGRH